MGDNMVQSRTVLELSGKSGSRVWFSQLDEPEGRTHLFGLDFSVWQDFGEPEVMTFTMEPGDKLNEEGNRVGEAAAAH